MTCQSASQRNEVIYRCTSVTGQLLLYINPVFLLQMFELFTRHPINPPHQVTRSHPLWREAPPVAPRWTGPPQVLPLSPALEDIQDRTHPAQRLSPGTEAMRYQKRSLIPISR